jgi:hypothetical protein
MSMRANKILPFLALAGFALVGLECPPPGGGGDDTGGSDTGSTGTTGGDTGGTASGFNGTITGTIKVQLYDVDGEGEYVYKDWTVWDGNFPFGAVWVYAFNTDESTGDETFYANQSILTPSVDGDDYSLTFSASAAHVRVGAQLDFYNDGIMGTSDPVGIYPDRLSVTDGSTAAGVDITILSYWNNASGSGGGCDGGGGSGSGGGSGGNGDGSTTISGDIIITEAYAAGDAVAMLMTTSLEGPLTWDWTTPVPTGGGAEGPYSMTVCSSNSEYALQGCWDSNFNSLVEADDKCGPYISEPDVDGNPITVRDDNLEEHDIQIPFGDYGLDLVPFVNLSGTITHEDGAFSGGTVYVGALKYKPDGEFSVSDIADASYDYKEYDTSGGETSFSYSLDVPSNTIAYLLAWDNEDGDSLINESDEAVGSGSSHDNGRLPTGSSSQVIDIGLSPYDGD